MAAVVEEWFRSPAWDDVARAEFEARLARARPGNRQQYLRIKGVSLRAAGELQGAGQLLERAAEYPDGHLFMTVAAWETLADMAAERGDRSTAERLYRRILTEQPGLSGTTGSVEISLAEVLLDGGGAERRDEALGLLNRWLERDQIKWASQLFRWHLDLIRIAEATGDTQTVRRAANTALSLAEQGPQLPNHPDIGLVKTDEATLKRLRRLAR